MYNASLIIPVGDKNMGRPASTRIHDTTSNRHFGVRLTDNEKEALGELAKKVQKELPRKHVTMSLVLRAVTYFESKQGIAELVKVVRLM